MQRGKKILLIGIMLVLIGIVVGTAAILFFENSLIEYDWEELFVTLSPDESRTIGFDFSGDSEVYFYFDYYSRGTPLKIVISDSDGKVIIDETIKNYVLEVPFDSPSGYYVLEITNVGSQKVDLYDFGYQEPPLERDENGNFVLPSGSWYSDTLESLIWVGIIVIIIGGIITIKDRRKIKPQPND